MPPPAPSLSSPTAPLPEDVSASVRALVRALARQAAAEVFVAVRAALTEEPHDAPAKSIPRPDQR